MIPFDIDKQTLNDLEIFDKNSDQKTLFNIFDSTCTIGGSATLKLIFKNPLTDIDSIVERSTLVEYLQKSGLNFVVDRGSIEFIAFYLQQNNRPKVPVGLFRIKKNIFVLGQAENSTSDREELRRY